MPDNIGFLHFHTAGANLPWIDDVPVSNLKFTMRRIANDLRIGG
jgi:hypothetical protein